MKVRIKGLTVFIALMGLVMGNSAFALPFSTLQGSQIRQNSSFEDQNYRWIYSAVEKVSGRFRGDEEERVSGNVERKIWEASPEFSPAEVYEFYLSQLQKLGASTKFSCINRSCGRSHVWATQIFKYSNLYGLDDHQFYSTGTLSTDEFSGVWVLYTVKRGNNKTYTLLDLVSISQKSDGIADFDVGSWFYVTDSNQLIVKELGHFLEQQPEKIKVLLVGNLPLNSENPLAGKELSLDYAREIRDQLLKYNIDESRVVARGLGGLSAQYHPDIPAKRVDILIWLEK